MVKKWMGSAITHCDLCDADIDTVFVDGKTIDGPWGILCPDCHEARGVGLGIGYGQKYEKKGKEWLKIEG